MRIGSNFPYKIPNEVGRRKNGNSARDIEGTEQELNKQIQELEKKKADLNKQIDKIKGDFAPPKPKDELIRPLKDQIQQLDKLIQQKQAERSKLQADKRNAETKGNTDEKGFINEQNNNDLDGTKENDSSTGSLVLNTSGETTQEVSNNQAMNRSETEKASELFRKNHRRHRKSNKIDVFV